MFLRFCYEFPCEYRRCFRLLQSDFYFCLFFFIYIKNKNKNKKKLPISSLGECILVGAMENKEEKSFLQTFREVCESTKLVEEYKDQQRLITSLYERELISFFIKAISFLIFYYHLLFPSFSSTLSPFFFFFLLLFCCCCCCCYFYCCFFVYILLFLLFY